MNFKKIITIPLIMMLLSTLVLAAVTGDADKDGNVTPNDFNLLINSIARNDISPEIEESCDLDNDKRISLNDVRLMLKQVKEAVPSIIVDSIDAQAGDIVEITVDVKNNPGIFDMILSFTYDSKAMVLTNVDNDKAEALGEATFLAPKNMASGCRATWYYMDEPDEYEDGSVVTLTFEILDTATAGEHIVSVSYIDGDINNFADDPLSFDIVKGIVTIK